jgi:hypothetical protein
VNTHTSSEVHALPRNCSSLRGTTARAPFQADYVSKCSKAPGTTTTMLLPFREPACRTGQHEHPCRTDAGVLLPILQGHCHCQLLTMAGQGR